MVINKKLFIIWIFGFISGFTLMLTGNTLNFWLATEQIDIKTIGIFAIVSLPYAINFLWAPLFDIKKIYILGNFLGPRMSWICVLLFFISLFTLMLSYINPKDTIITFAIISTIISVLSSAADTVLGALRTEIIPKGSQGVVSGIYTFGYRIGMLISSSGAILLSSLISWSSIYKIFALFLIFFPLFVIFNLKKFLNIEIVKEEQNKLLISEGKKTLKISNFISKVLKPIGTTKTILIIIIFLILYRLPDNFINQMINLFLIHLKYNELQIATVGKSFGILASIIGGIMAGLIMRNYSITTSLLIFGILHTIAHSLFIIQEILGNNILLLSIVIGFESLTGGMAMAAYIGFIASLCEGKYRATQYSFLTSMMGLSRSTFPVFSGYIVTMYGWFNFFIFIVLISIPSLLIIKKLSKILNIKSSSNDR